MKVHLRLLKALVLVTVLVLAGALPALAAGEPANGGSLFVTGEGEVALQADVAHVQLAVETLAKTTVEAQRENARLTTAVVTRLGGLGLPKDAIKSAGFSIHPVTTYDAAKGKQLLTGYQVNNRLSVTVKDLDRVGTVVDTAVAAGATTVYDVTFTTANVSAAEAEALRRACAQARRKAETMSGALGLTLGKVLSVSDEVSTSGPPYLMYAKASGAADAAPSTPFMPGEVKVRARVTVQFAIAD
ncbi:MAG: SIMPL domain-containing protein [Chitinophagales bacterium]